MGATQTAQRSGCSWDHSARSRYRARTAKYVEAVSRRGSPSKVTLHTFTPLGGDLRSQVKVFLGGIDVENLGPEQPDEPVGKTFEGAVVHVRFEFFEVVDQQFPDP